MDFVASAISSFVEPISPSMLGATCVSDLADGNPFANIAEGVGVLARSRRRILN